MLGAQTVRLTVAEQIEDMAKNAKSASQAMAKATTARKDAVLAHISAALQDLDTVERILQTNGRDLEKAQAAGMSGAMLDRLRLNAERVAVMAKGVEQIIALPDPVGSTEQMRRVPSGLEVGRMRVPLGVIAMIYESRPNVTIDVAALCIKSGNACILRGGSEAFLSNMVLSEVVRQALAKEGLPEDAVSLIPLTDRDATLELVRLTGLIDLVIPRGGESLIRMVTENARVPVIQHYKGVCHVYVDSDADLEMAEQIVVNAKVQRPSTCNAMETLLVDHAVARAFVPRIVARLRGLGVEVRGDEQVRALTNDAKAANPEDWDTEYNDLKCSMAVVNGFDGALAHVRDHGTHHTEAIVTRNYEKAQRWLREVDASLVLVNASTRFNDGAELGLGAEVGISTTKMHAYGPMGLEELCTRKWIAWGQGQVRQ